WQEFLTDTGRAYIDSIVQMSPAEFTWLDALSTQHKNAGSRVVFHEIMAAYHYFLNELEKLGLRHALPEICGISGIKHIKPTLFRLISTIIPRSDNLEEQLCNLGGLDLRPYANYFAKVDRYENFRLVTAAMQLTPEAILTSTNAQCKSFGPATASKMQGELRYTTNGYIYHNTPNIKETRYYVLSLQQLFDAKPLSYAHAVTLYNRHIGVSQHTFDYTIYGELEHMIRASRATEPQKIALLYCVLCHTIGQKQISQITPGTAPNPLAELRMLLQRLKLSDPSNSITLQHYTVDDIEYLNACTKKPDFTSGLHIINQILLIADNALIKSTSVSPQQKQELLRLLSSHMDHDGEVMSAANLHLLATRIEKNPKQLPHFYNATNDAQTLGLFEVLNTANNGAYNFLTESWNVVGKISSGDLLTYAKESALFIICAHNKSYTREEIHDLLVNSYRLLRNDHPHPAWACLRRVYTNIDFTYSPLPSITDNIAIIQSIIAALQTDNRL
ncbi:MAG TPA: hypothetical protein VHD33_03420, partial [Legionellaceae bacterium]|nr:hypothetical protein [Legionellaceae bacterium]